MGSIAIASPFTSLKNALLAGNQAVQGFGNPMFRYKYSGAIFDIAQTDANGGAHAFTFPTPPTDAVGMEVWVNAAGSTDYLFWRHIGGQLSATGVLATAAAENIAGKARWVNSGNHAIIPFLTVGTVPSTLRFAFNTASGSRLQGRYISQSAGFPYRLAAAEEDAFTGAGAKVTLNTGVANKYPAGYTAIVMQVYGGPMRVCLDGTDPTATLGDIVPAGTYIIDFSRHGVSATALEMYLPAGCNLLVNSLFNA